MLAQIIMACVPQDGEYIVSQRSSRVGCCLAVRWCLSIGQLTVDKERKGLELHNTSQCFCLHDWCLQTFWLTSSGWIWTIYLFDYIKNWGSMAVTKTFKLNTGAEMPAVGLGTWQSWAGCCWYAEENCVSNYLLNFSWHWNGREDSNSSQTQTYWHGLALWVTNP